MTFHRRALMSRSDTRYEALISFALDSVLRSSTSICERNLKKQNVAPEIGLETGLSPRGTTSGRKLHFQASLAYRYP